MEINVLFMVLFMSLQSKSTMNSFNYFIIQSISSLILLMLMIIKNYMLDNNNLINSLIILTFSLKLGMFPFFIWMPIIYSNMNWILIFFMSTTQKIIPMLILNLMFNFNNQTNIMQLIYLMVIISSMIASLLSIKELNMKKIFSFSSINHSSWMLFIISIDQSMFFLYFLFYSFSMIFVCLILNKFDINKINQLFKLNLFNHKFINMLLSLNILILSSLPPFLTFLIKMNTMKVILFNNHLITILMFTILSIFTVIFYMTILIKMNLILLIKSKIWIQPLKLNNKFYSIILTMILTSNILFLLFQMLI
uniref:NADH-ubiquinone oxidoreductase chain 2 n=1 Tax=Parapolybia varia TaxID=91407 RepID=A0A514CQK4_9HYME|nr:NADH dehydrogenase subunit 2 [Parapolybia varia]